MIYDSADHFVGRPAVFRPCLDYFLLVAAVRFSRGRL